MGIMQKTKKITVEGLGEIEARELTVEQVNDLMNRDMTDRPFYTVEALLDSALPIEAVCMATGLSAETLNGDITPSAAEQVWKAATEVNRFLSRMLERFKPALPVAPAAGKSGT